jgi:hypothetical protein
VSLLSLSLTDITCILKSLLNITEYGSLLICILPAHNPLTRPRILHNADICHDISALYLGSNSELYPQPPLTVILVSKSNLVSHILSARLRWGALSLMTRKASDILVEAGEQYNEANGTI